MKLGCGFCPLAIGLGVAADDCVGGDLEENNIVGGLKRRIMAPR